MTPPDAFLRTYFDRAAADPESYCDLFAPDAEVRDDGGEYHGTAEIRGWRTSVPTVSYEVLDVRDDGGTTETRTRISGDFPGSPVTLTFRFDLDDSGLIRRLVIHP